MGGVNDKNFIAIFGGAFGGVGLLLLIGAILVYSHTNKSRQGAILIKGKVIGLSPSQSSKGGTTYTPKVEFQINNQTFQIYGSVSSNPPAFDIDEEVELFVNPKSPQTASINSFTENWFVVLILGFMGTIFATIGISVVWNASRKKHVQQ
ncbi:MAG: DUF3592 domain-containing protein [Cytophagales bacterium]|nr:MAG: DUF3592 domain-containing protein [Cytophagales bacterium]